MWFLVIWAVLLVLVVFVGWRFAQKRHRNYSPPANAEKLLSAREALRFGVDNGLLDRSQTVHYIQPRKGKPI